MAQVTVCGQRAFALIYRLEDADIGNLSPWWDEFLARGCERKECGGVADGSKLKVSSTMVFIYCLN
jgi:hypothetical protein